MDIAYRGTAYHGWQVQPNAHTVQEVIHHALSTLLRHPVECVGSGRTDTGVHASQQIAHFDAEPIADCAQFVYRLNALLPHDVAVRSVRPVQPQAHARFDAVSRRYHYYIHSAKDPFRQGLSYFFAARLNMDNLNAGLDILSGQRDFQAFSKVHTDVHTFDCEIMDLWWKPSNEGHVFSVKANRFLRGMVRALVGTLLEMGTNKLSPEGLLAILASGDRSAAGRAVPADGLFLTEVTYPETIYLES